MSLLLLNLESIWSYSSSYNLESSERYIQFAGIAYCADPLITDNSVANWSCKFCKNYPNTTATVFYGGKATDQLGYVAYDPNANEIIVSFAGTDPVSIRNWIDDIDFIKTSYPYCSSTNCQVHEGFYRTYESVKDDMLIALKNYKNLHSSASISVTGHSLGAALAALCTAELTHLGYKLKPTYNYGMPRLGDDNFYKWYYGSSNIAGTFRVVHHKDPVPHVPFNNWGFHHFPYEVFYEDDYTKYKVCDTTGEDPTCGNKYAVDANVVDHARYMGWDFGAEYFSWGCKI